MCDDPLLREMMILGGWSVYLADPESFTYQWKSPRGETRLGWRYKLADGHQVPKPALENAIFHKDLDVKTTVLHYVPDMETSVLEHEYQEPSLTFWEVLVVLLVVMLLILLSIGLD